MMRIQNFPPACIHVVYITEMFLKCAIPVMISDWMNTVLTCLIIIITFMATADGSDAHIW